MLYPYLNYCICVWGNTYDSYLQPLFKLQKRAIRIISGQKRNSPTDSMFKKLKILKLRQIYLYSVQQFVFKFHHRMLPCIFDAFFVLNSSFHSHNTRSRNLYRPPVLNTSRVDRTIRVMGVRTHNYFSSRLAMDRSFLSYKATLRHFLINNDVTI